MLKFILPLLVILIIAGLADIKYKGLFYRSLPKSVQNLLDRKQ